MNAVERLQAAITKLETLKSESTAGRWFFEPPSERPFPQSDASLLATDDTWGTCGYYCTFAPNSLTSRGEPGKPGHEHLNSESVLTGWGYDASGIDGSDADRELIVTLHRTIDAQLAILREGLQRAQDVAAFPKYWYLPPTAETLTLADAILGGES